MWKFEKMWKLRNIIKSNVNSAFDTPYGTWEAK